MYLILTVLKLVFYAASMINCGNRDYVLGLFFLVLGLLLTFFMEFKYNRRVDNAGYNQDSGDFGSLAYSPDCDCGGSDCDCGGSDCTP